MNPAYDRGLLVGLRTSLPTLVRSTNRGVDAVSDRTGAARDRIHVRKTLIPSRYLNGVRSPANNLREYLKKIGYPWGDNMYLVASRDISAIDAKARECRQRYEDAVRRFVDDYPRIVTEGISALSQLGLAADYVAPSSIENEFSWEFVILPLTSVRDLEQDLRIKLPTEIAEEQAEVAQRMEQMRIEGIVSSVLKEVVDFVSGDDGVVTKLKDHDTENGREGVRFREKSLRKKVRTLKTRLVTAADMLGSESLDQTIDDLAEMERTLDGLSKNELQHDSDGTVRHQVAAEFEQIAQRAVPNISRLKELMG